MWDLIVSVPDHCLSFYVPLYAFYNDVYLVSLRLVVLSQSTIL